MVQRRLHYVQRYFESNSTRRSEENIEKSRRCEPRGSGSDGTRRSASGSRSVGDCRDWYSWTRRCRARQACRNSMVRLGRTQRLASDGKRRVEALPRQSGCRPAQDRPHRFARAPAESIYTVVLGSLYCMNLKMFENLCDFDAYETCAAR